MKENGVTCAILRDKFVRTARCLPTFSGVRVRFSSDPLSWGNRSPATGWCLCNSFRAHSCPEKVPPGPVPVNPAVRHTPVLAHSFPSCSGGSVRSGGRTPAGRRRGRKESLFPEPLFGGFRPLIRGMSAFFHAIPVASRGIEVQTGGNPLFPQACSISLLLAQETPSSRAWTRNTGGACSVTCLSAEHISSRAGDGWAPNILLRVPPWVVWGAMVMTG